MNSTGKHQFKIGNSCLEIVDQYKYLGIMLNHNLDVSLIQEQLAGAGSRALGTIIGKTKSNYDLSFSSYSTLFQSCIEPILDYGSGAWNIGNKCDKIDAVQFRALRFYLGVHKTTSLLYLTGEAGWIPGIVKRDLNVIRVYNELVQMPSSRLG